MFNEVIIQIMYVHYGIRLWCCPFDHFDFVSFENLLLFIIGGITLTVFLDYLKFARHFYVFQTN